MWLKSIPTSISHGMNDMENKRKVIDILIVVSMPFQTIFIIIF